MASLGKECLHSGSKEERRGGESLAMGSLGLPLLDLWMAGACTGRQGAPGAGRGLQLMVTSLWGVWPSEDWGEGQ